MPASATELQRWPEPTATQERRGRLGDFCFAGRLGPIAGFLAVAAGLFVWRGAAAPLAIFLKLWCAYAVAFTALALLGRAKGQDAGWVWVLPCSIAGVVLGGGASALIGVAPNWEGLFNPRFALPDWSLGAAFSAFFVGLSLATSEIRRREQLAAEARRQLVEARLQTLTAQIEPHFLMNTLANLRYLIKANSVMAATMLDHLADFLQGALERSRSAHSTLEQEFRLVENYLAIMRFRMGSRLEFKTILPAELGEMPFPALLLQTLVENAVAHGIEPHGGRGSVCIAARHEGSRIALSVTDDGVGFDAPDDDHPGLGLRNTRERLATFFDGEASFEIARHAPSGTVATISIPAPGGGA